MTIRSFSCNDFMSGNTSNACDGRELVRNSWLYREFQAEREEILKHKWIESEKAGYDLGFEWALTDWILRHRSKWRQGRHAAHNQSFSPDNANLDEGAGHAPGTEPRP